MHHLSRYSALSGRPAIQLEAGPPNTNPAAASPAKLGLPAALKVAGQSSELWVRWGSARDWCLFRQGRGERPTARCSCGYAGLGLLQCGHLAEAHSTLLTAPTAGSAGSTAEATAAPAAAAAAAAYVLNVSSLDWACSQARHHLINAVDSRCCLRACVLACVRACLLACLFSLALSAACLTLLLTLLLPAPCAACR